MMLKSVLQNTEERFFFVAGATADEFCTPDLRLLNIEELVHEHLKVLGYEKIVFYSGGGKGLYFYDKHSYDLVFNKEAIPKPTKKRRRSKIVAGPIGRRVKKTSSLTQEHNKELHKVDSLQRSLSDENMLSTISNIIKDKTKKSAIVFSNWEDFVTKSSNNIQRVLSNKIAEWDRLGSDNDNILLFLIPEMDLNSIETIIHTSHLENLNSKILLTNGENKELNTSSVLWLDIPNKDEIEHIVRYWSFQKDLPINWLEYSESIDTLFHYVKENQKSLESISRKVKQLSEISLHTINKALHLTSEKKGFAKLDEMQGVGYIKERLTEIVNRVQHSQKKQQATSATLKEIRRLYGLYTTINTKENLHIALIGNPGTGKTTIAKIIAEIYKEHSILETGHLVKVTRDDLVAGYVGQTAIKTKEKINEAMGGVLFIDEAYTLIEGGENDFGQEAINTILEAMSDRNGAFSVVIAGYPDDMKKFLESNAGLSRRFKNQIYLKDYEPDVLETIFRSKMTKEGFSLDSAFDEMLHSFLTNWFLARDEKNFGNAGAVEILFEKISQRAIKEVRKQLLLKDIPQEYQEYAKKQTNNSLKDAFSHLDGIIGLQNVKSNIESIINSIKVSKKRSKGTKVSAGHYVFSGNPGTGKTEIARRMGSILKDLKVLPKGHFIEVTREDLVGGYIGQTAPKTKEVLEKALGGVLFIDEAYTLSRGGENDFGQEAIDTIVPFIENHKDDFTLIIAGYPNDIEVFLSANEGLKSRFNHTIEFEDYSDIEMFKVFKLFLEKEGLELHKDVEEIMPSVFKELRAIKAQDFGNARDARKLSKEIIKNLNNRIAPIIDTLEDGAQELSLILLDDIPQEYQDDSEFI